MDAILRILKILIVLYRIVAGLDLSCRVGSILYQAIFARLISIRQRIIQCCLPGKVHFPAGWKPVPSW